MQRVVVLGGGESGIGSAVLAKVKGFDVFLSDSGKIKDDAKATLAKWDIQWEEGGHTMEKILNANEIIKSPGIPDNVPLLVAAREKGISIISEIEKLVNQDLIEIDLNNIILTQKGLDFANVVFEEFI